jgi:peptidoglycan/LPS O-acetylase OafA/YrhL
VDLELGWILRKLFAQECRNSTRYEAWRSCWFVFYHGFFWSNALTGLSGIAKLFANLKRIGWVGVNLLFVLSGFLITGILADSKTNKHYYRRFYVRRALRILFAFYALLLVLSFIPSQSRTLRWLYSGQYLLERKADIHAREDYQSI